VFYEYRQNHWLQVGRAGIDRRFGYFDPSGQREYRTERGQWPGIDCRLIFFSVVPGAKFHVLYTRGKESSCAIDAGNLILSVFQSLSHYQSEIYRDWSRCLWVAMVASLIL
jgi:hypothetical protein